MNPVFTNVFIIDDNLKMASELELFLKNKFNNTIAISKYFSSQEALKNINNSTEIVIMDVYLEGNKGNEVIGKIKEINPNTEVIMFTSNEHVAASIEAFQHGADEYIIKSKNGRKTLLSVMYSTIGYPLRILVEEFGVSRYIAIFILTFISMGVIALFIYKTRP